MSDIPAPFRMLSSYAYPLLFNPNDQDQYYHLQNLLHKQQESNDHQHQLMSRSSHWKVSNPSDDYSDEDINCSLKLSLCTQVEQELEEQPNIKWMSSKMRIMRKMMNSDRKLAQRQTKRSLHEQTLAHDQNMVSNQDTVNSAGVIRVCSDCNTTKTPLWRSGPRGPKSLCNACGIRQRKARRAAENDRQIMQIKSVKLPQERNMFGDQALPFKKRGRINVNSDEKKKLCFESLSNKSAIFHQQDEKDAAFLLMDLSLA